MEEGFEFETEGFGGGDVGFLHAEGGEFAGGCRQGGYGESGGERGGEWPWCLHFFPRLSRVWGWVGGVSGFRCFDLDD